MSIWAVKKDQGSGQDAKQRSAQDPYRSIEDKMYEFFSDIAINNGYADREKQYDMAEEILDAIKCQSNLIVEAGVGIGKTFAYLVPALLCNEKFQNPIIIATSTIALQEQLMDDVENVAKMLNLKSVSPVLAKGQGNYLCAKRLKTHYGPMRQKLFKMLRDGCYERSSSGFSIPDSIWDKVKIENFSKKCSKDCSEYCPYATLRENLPYEMVTICNQNLLAVHMKKYMYGGASILNTGLKTIVIVDEAHNLEDKTREALQTEITERKIISRIGAAAGGIINREAIAKDTERAKRAAINFFREIRKQMKKQDNEADADIIRYYFHDNNGVIKDLAKAIESFHATVGIYASMQNKYDYQALEEIEELKDSLKCLSNHQESFVVWIERNGTFCFCGSDIRETANEMYFCAGNPLFILTSATLTGTSFGEIEDQYSYVANGLGFDGDFSEPKESPFNYDEHAMMYISDHLPHPTKEHERFIREGIDLLKKILAISEGRALVLFTSKKDMQEVYENLKNSEFHVFMQAAGASQQETLEAFRQDEHSVLLGTGAYWEGINVEGQTLSNVVIFRLPFPVPDPILEAREKKAENPLMDVKVPEMIIKLKQGVGRLIRSETDRGIISIIDSRAGDSSKAPYRDVIRKALPIKNITGSLEEIRDFYKGLSEKTANF